MPTPIEEISTPLCVVTETTPIDSVMSWLEQGCFDDIPGDTVCLPYQIMIKKTESPDSSFLAATWPQGIVKELYPFVVYEESNIILVHKKTETFNYIPTEIEYAACGWMYPSDMFTTNEARVKYSTQDEGIEMFNGEYSNESLEYSKVCMPQNWQSGEDYCDTFADDVPNILVAGLSDQGNKVTISFFLNE